MNSIIVSLGGIIFIVILVILVLILISCVKIVHQAQAVVVERLGAYLTTWNTGLHFKIPIIDRVARRIDLKEQVVDFPPQPVITEDNVTMQIDTVIFYQITGPKMFCYGVASPIIAIENLTATTPVISSAIWNWTRRSPPARRSIRKCGRNWTVRPTPGASK